MRILHVSMECFPYSKVGGMADVVGALPDVLAAAGADCQVLTPYYPQLFKGDTGDEIAAFDVWIGDAPHPVRLLDTGGAGILVDQPTAFDRAGVYYDPLTGDAYEDSLYQCLVLQQAARIAVRDGHVPADVVHCHDNHTGLLPVYLKDDGGPPSVFTIHNLAYQGLYGGDTFWLTGLARDRFHGYSAFEFHGDLSLMKAGLIHADRVTTVSPNYAAEIVRPEFGHGLDGVLRWLGDRLSGILNGIDTEAWNPVTDPRLAANFSAKERQGKAECKKALCKEFGLKHSAKTPLIGLVSRLSHQKGLDLIGHILPHLARRGAQIALLGSGDPSILDLFRGAQGRWPGQVALWEGFSEDLAHRVYAGADIFAMPSRFEPCGLSQMYAMRYGAVPVVTKMGGLVDTVTPFDEEHRDGTGILADWATSESLQGALDYALDLFPRKRLWNRMVANGMKKDWSWARAAQAYVALYEELLPA